jgi:predicted ATPase
MTSPSVIRDGYQRKIEECDRAVAARKRQDFWLGHLRVATFLPAIAIFYVAVFHAEWVAVWLLAGAAFIAAFIVTVRVHEYTLRRAAELRQRLAINEAQLARLDRRWGDVPPCKVEVSQESAAVANDLDVFGHASLYQLVSQAHTPFGRDTLRDWLIHPAPPADIVDRHGAISHLAPAVELREHIVLLGRMLSVNDQGTLAFVEWAEAPPFLTARPWLQRTTIVSSVVMLLSLLGAIVGLVNAAAAFLVIVALTCLHLVLVAIYGGRIYDTLERVTNRTHDVRQYRPLFEIIATLPPDVPLFSKLQSHMGATPQEPLRQLEALTRLVRFANLRRDGLFGIPYYLSQLFVLTDFHVLARMERWQKMNGSNVRRWLEAVGRLEAITSLATLAHDYPQWCMPAVEQAAGSTISGTQIGHPLLPDEGRVSNDIEIGPAGTFILVTGSNMSGKSTLLRAAGLNIILAQAGAPVCAKQLRMPPVELATSMRTHDSLADGVSFFLAELRRLKQIVDESRKSQRDSKLLVYLLDEVLQGTNSVERHIAVYRVIDHLVEHGSIGIVSTHDLELARSPNLATVCQTVHFRESFAGHDGHERMTFDYILRPGLATTTNALKLLKLVGLDD